ncbi:MAG: NADH-quinone oxidoreductase subunit C, partial [Gemmatimonadaceae bacterium]
HTGGESNPSAEALRARFGAAIERVDVVWGETTVHVQGARLLDVVRWLHDDPSQQYDYLSDVTAVEHRDLDQPLEVVWHLRSLPFRRFLRLKVQIPQGGKLEVDSVWPVYKGADWLEREAYDMFGVNFRGHPDMRRILMWESFKEGYPLRKDFPLRGRFSRSEQLRQALDQDPEARYSMEELSVADAFEDLPPDMRERLASGEKVGE